MEAWEVKPRSLRTPWLHVFKSLKERNRFLESGNAVQNGHCLEPIDSRRAKDCEYYHYCRYGNGSYCEYEKAVSGLMPARPILLH